MFRMLTNLNNKSFLSIIIQENIFGCKLYLLDFVIGFLTLYLLYTMCNNMQTIKIAILT